jgi:glycosyltransferase involved in cell wall biosynthesis
VSETISIIMPAFRAEAFIANAVNSVLAQTYADWELILISDDEVDYSALLAAKGIVDKRFRFLSSGRMKAGASRARNIGLDTVTTNWVAVLDADDRFKPKKLERATAALAEHPIVTTALEVTLPDFTPLRTVGTGPDRLLTASQHKWVNFSMETMVAWDRRKVDARYDPDLPNMTDLDFMMKLYRTSETSFHLGEALHDYVKLPVSMTNGPGVTERMVRVKTLLLERLASGHYPMADAGAVEGISRFLLVSLEAEKSYPAKLAARPGLLFEDGLEPMLLAAGGA